MSKFTKLLLSLLMLTLLVIQTGSPIVADMHTEEEVNGIIDKIDKKVGELKKKGAEVYAKNEFDKISEQIESTRKLLKNGQYDKAYFEIRIGVEYVELVMAREKLYKSKEAFDTFDETYK